MKKKSSTLKSKTETFKGFAREKKTEKLKDDPSSIMSRLSFESIHNGIVELKVKATQNGRACSIGNGYI